MLFPSSLYREFQLLQYIGSQGIPVPSAIAYFQIHHKFQWEELLVTRMVKHAINAKDFFLKCNKTKESKKTKRCLLYNLGKTVRALHDIGVCHNDLHGENILFVTTPPNYKIYIVDFGRGYLIKKNSLKSKLWDLARLDDGLHKYLSLSDRPPGRGPPRS